MSLQEKSGISRFVARNLSGRGGSDNGSQTTSAALAVVWLTLSSSGSTGS